jgi:type III secretory pathway component EscR
MVMSNTHNQQKKLQKQIDKLSNLIDKNNDKVKDFQHRVKGLEEQNHTHTQLIQFYKDTLNLTPTILYNSGRDKKYVYGKVWWFSDGMGSKKKGYRYFLGKMDEKKPKSFWEDKLLSVFFEKEKETIEKIKP